MVKARLKHGLNQAQATKISLRMERYKFHLGGAAGNCPRVQKVIYYSSTSLVCTRFYDQLGYEYQQKYLASQPEKCPTILPLPSMVVSDMSMTPSAAMSPATDDDHSCLGCNWRKCQLRQSDALLQ